MEAESTNYLGWSHVLHLKKMANKKEDFEAQCKPQTQGALQPRVRDVTEIFGDLCLLHHLIISLCPTCLSFSLSPPTAAYLFKMLASALTKLASGTHC